MVSMIRSRGISPGWDRVNFEEVQYTRPNLLRRWMVRLVGLINRTYLSLCTADLGGNDDVIARDLVCKRANTEDGS